jgi:hypothetical protein
VVDVMHDAGHALVESIAAAILVAGGGILLVLAWRARTTGGPDTLLPEAPDALSGAVRTMAAGLSIGAAVIHFGAVPGHIQEAAWVGPGLVVAGTFQAAWALAWLIERSPSVIRFGILGNLVIVALWLVSRTSGLPVGDLAGRPEAIGGADAAATLYELLLVGLLAVQRRGLNGRLSARLRGAGSVATIAVVPAIGMVLVVTTLALASLTGHGHTEDDGHGGVVSGTER